MRLWVHPVKRQEKKERLDRRFFCFLLENYSGSVIIPSLTVCEYKNCCNPDVYWSCSNFSLFMKYGNLFPALTLFLNFLHFSFAYKIIICSKSASFMKIIRDLLPCIQGHKSLFLDVCKVHLL